MMLKRKKKERKTKTLNRLSRSHCHGGLPRQVRMTEGIVAQEQISSCDDRSNSPEVEDVVRWKYENTNEAFRRFQDTFIPFPLN